MASFETSTLIRLQPGEAVSLDDVRGATLRVTRGIVWITQEREPRDVVLRQGDNWIVERDGRTVVEAQADVHLRVLGHALAAPLAPAANERSYWGDRLARLFSLTTPRAVPYF